ncbi:MAG: hypothetical protein ACKVS6_17200 [Planctomycetota bacterium]
MKELPNFSEFEQRARVIFEAIPGEFRDGISVLVVHQKRVPHPHLDDYETLGECETDFLSDPADLRSRIHIYFGSFTKLARGDDGFDWEWELKETIEHEIRHHLEDRAGLPDLEKQDWAEEQNVMRAAGKSYDPLFYRAGEERERDEFWVDHDCFLEVRLSRRQLLRIAGKLHAVTFGEQVFDVLVPAQGGEVRYVNIDGGWVDDDGNAGGLFVVFVTPRVWIKK